MLDAASAWLAIGHRLLMDEQVAFGLCREIRRLREEDVITGETVNKMMDQVFDHLSAAGRSCGYAYAPGEHAHERAMAALWMALEANEELYEQL